MMRSIATALLLGICATASAAGQDRLLQHFAALQPHLNARAQHALGRMNGLGQQLLATRAYLRAGDAIDQRWSWSEDQISAYSGSPQQSALDAEINKVRAAFERANPGYTLFVNPHVRSLDLQLQRWNQNSSVTRAANFMTTALSTAIQQPDFPPPGSPAAVAKFQQLLRDQRPQPLPTLAAPGLSAHGRMNAVDFQVRHGNQTIAGPDSGVVGSVWIAQGWRDRLLAAVRNSGARFEGPLANPVEPWHYDYRP
jgi:hypothetical protein